MWLTTPNSVRQSTLLWRRHKNSNTHPEVKPVLKLLPRAMRFTLSRSLSASSAVFVCVLILTAASISAVASDIREVLAFVTGLLCVCLVVKKSIWNFPIGLVNCSLYGSIFLENRLYWDTLLQGIYFVLGVLGWYWWWAGQRDGVVVRAQLPIRHAALPVLLLGIFIVAVSTPFMMHLSIFAGGAAPLWDSLATAISLVAQYLLGRKIIENWLFWISADLIYVPLFYSRELYLTSILYGVFLCLCVAGWLSWREELKVSAI